jgi:riboflavin kinase/FMN adenylyltransferase
MIKTTKNTPFQSLPRADYGLILGNFDGVHLGHQKLINNFIKECQKNKIEPVLITFNPHPYVFFCNDDSEFLISTYSSKKEKLLELGLAHILELEFSEELQNMSAENFILKYLFSINNLKLVYLGHDFKLGKGKTDAFKLMDELARDRNIKILKEEAYFYNDKLVSSSRIRKAVKNDIKSANTLLGDSFCLEGNIVKGKGLGRKSLFRTANLKPFKNQLLPSTGVYLTQIIISDKIYDAITNIGFNPTVSDKNLVSIETHIFNFEKDIYGEEVKLNFILKQRDEIKFENLSELKFQIQDDIDAAKIYFREKSPYKLALIGRDISHSKSQDIYEKLFERCVNYSLLDFKVERDIPTPSELKNSFDGISITSPYKTFFINNVVLDKKELKAINCLVFNSDSIKGYNTDYYAILDILKDFIKTGVDEVFVLGDGVMGSLTCDVLFELGLKFTQLSRKLKNLDESAILLESKNQKTLVINTCNRDYCFKAPSSGTFKFWDMNYNLDHHSQLFSKATFSYTDGMSLLELQAKYALSFWNLKTF